MQSLHRPSILRQRGSLSDRNGITKCNDQAWTVEEPQLMWGKGVTQHRTLEAPPRVRHISALDDLPQGVEVLGSQDPDDLLILIDRVVELAAHKQSGLMQYRCDETCAGSLETGDDEGAPRLPG